MLEMQIYGNTIQEYLIAMIIMLIIFSGLAILLYLFKKILKKIDQKNPEKPIFFLKILEALSWPLFLVVGLSIGVISLERTEMFSKILKYVLMIIVTIYVAKIIVKIINYISKKIIEKNKESQKDPEKDPAVIEIYAKLL